MSRKHQAPYRHKYHIVEVKVKTDDVFLRRTMGFGQVYKSSGGSLNDECEMYVRLSKEESMLMMLKKLAENRVTGRQRVTVVLIVLVIILFLGSLGWSQENGGNLDDMGEKVFCVDWYGAVSDSGKDAGPAIKRAIEDAICAGDGAVVTFSKGTYYVDSTGAFHIDIFNARKLTIDGNSAELIFRNPTAGGIRFVDSDDCVVRNLSLDYDPVPFTQGIITSVDSKGGTFDLKLDSEYPSLDEKWFMPKTHSGFAMQRDRATGRLKENAVSAFFPDAWVRLGDMIYRIILKDDGYRSAVMRNMEIGDSVVYVIRNNGGGVVAWRSNNLVIDNVKIYAAPSAAILAGQSDNLTVRKVSVLVKPQTNRINSTNGDGVHCPGARTGPTIENSFFEGMSDDGVNIYMPPHIVYYAEGESKLIIDGGPPVQQGDLLEVLDPKSGKLRGLSRVQSLEKVGETAYAIMLETPVPGVKAGLDYKESDHVYNRNTCGEGFIIRNNTFQDYRGRGILIRSGNGIIEGNTLRELSGVAISVVNEPDWPEGPMSRNIVIRNNTIDYVGYSGHQGSQSDGGAIQIKGVRFGYGLSDWRGQREFVIENNRIKNWPMAAIYIGSAQDVQVIGNIVEMEKERQTYGGLVSGIILENVEDVIVKNLNMTDGRRIRAGVLIKESVVEDGVHVDGININLRKGVPEVLDLRKK